MILGRPHYKCTNNHILGIAYSHNIRPLGTQEYKALQLITVQLSSPSFISKFGVFWTYGWNPTRDEKLSRWNSFSFSSSWKKRRRNVCSSRIPQQYVKTGNFVTLLSLNRMVFIAVSSLPPKDKLFFSSVLFQQTKYKREILHQKEVLLRHYWKYHCLP